MWSSCMRARVAWWASKRPTSASRGSPILGRIRVSAMSASTSGSRSPAMRASTMRRQDTPWMSLAT